MEEKKNIDIQFEWFMMTTGIIMSFTGLISTAVKCVVVAKKARKETK